MDKYDIARVFKSLDKSVPDILLYDELEQLVPCIFLYTGIHTGHWCAILKHKDSWEIFDPIGVWPDTELQHPHIKKVPPKLQQLSLPLAEKGYRIDYNHFNFQKGGSACGLWCILRWLNKHMDCDSFIAAFEKVTDRDVCLYFNRMDLLKE